MWNRKPSIYCLLCTVCDAWTKIWSHKMVEQAVSSSSFEVQLFTLFLLTFVVNFLRVILNDYYV